MGYTGAMNLTERYIELCKLLANAGYQWRPQPGDWMVDLTDDSIGMLTLEPDKPQLVAMVNVHLPMEPQVLSMLSQREVSHKAASGQVTWWDRHGKSIHECSAEVFACDSSLQHLEALVKSFTGCR